MKLQPDCVHSCKGFKLSLKAIVLTKSIVFVQESPYFWCLTPSSPLGTRTRGMLIPCRWLVGWKNSCPLLGFWQPFLSAYWRVLEPPRKSSNSTFRFLPIIIVDIISFYLFARAIYTFLFQRILEFMVSIYDTYCTEMVFCAKIVNKSQNIVISVKRWGSTQPNMAFFHHGQIVSHIDMTVNSQR